MVEKQEKIIIELTKRWVDETHVTYNLTREEMTRELWEKNIPLGKIISIMHLSADEVENLFGNIQKKNK